MRCLLHLKGASMNSTQVHKTNGEAERERLRAIERERHIERDSKCTQRALHVCALEVYSISIIPAWHDSNDLCICSTTLQNASINMCDTHTHSDRERVRVSVFAVPFNYALAELMTHIHTHSQTSTRHTDSSIEKVLPTLRGQPKTFSKSNVKCALTLEKSN